MKTISDELADKIKSLFNDVNNSYEGVRWNDHNFILDETGDLLQFGGIFVQQRIYTQDNKLYLKCLDRINYNYPSQSGKRGKIGGSPSNFKELFDEAKRYEQFKDILNNIDYNQKKIIDPFYLELGPINELDRVINKIFNIVILKLHYGGIIRGTLQPEIPVRPMSSCPAEHIQILGLTDKPSADPIPDSELRIWLRQNGRDIPLPNPDKDKKTGTGISRFNPMPWMPPLIKDIKEGRIKNEMAVGLFFILPFLSELGYTNGDIHPEKTIKTYSSIIKIDFALYDHGNHKLENQPLLIVEAKCRVDRLTIIE